MPTLAQMRTAIDTFIDVRWPTVVQRQETFFANRGHYWQGLITHSALPAHTTTVEGSTVPTRWNVSPSDQSSSWNDVLPEWALDLFPAALFIDAYTGIDGSGWTLTAAALHNGAQWRRTVNIGPETWRVRPWVQWNPTPLPRP